MKKCFIIILLTYCFLCFSSCTSQAWYEGFKDMEREKCNKIESATERQECLDKVNKTSYDQYQREREESKNQQ